MIGRRLSQEEAKTMPVGGEIDCRCSLDRTNKSQKLTKATNERSTAQAGPVGSTKGEQKMGGTSLSRPKSAHPLDQRWLGSGTQPELC
jgi:hypothetical protein